MGASLSSQTSGRVVTIEAQPEPIAIDTVKTAVIVVDMQNDFGAKGGMLDRAGIDLSVIRRAIARTARVLSAARRAGISIVYLKMGFRADLSDAGPPDSPNRIKHPLWLLGKASARQVAEKVDFNPRHMEHGHTGRTRPAARGHGPLQNPLQRLLPNGLGRSAPKTGSQSLCSHHRV